jgi:hypothetical protein
MSGTISYEFGFSCPHPDCKFRSKKYNSIESVNMHFAKIHNKKQKMTIIQNNSGNFRLVLRMK